MSPELEEAMKNQEKITVVMKLKALNEEILAELRKYGEIEEMVKLTKHVQMTLTPKQIEDLAKKDYIIKMDILREMRAVK